MEGAPWIERAREVRDRIYGEPLPAGLVVVPTDEQTYWRRHEAELRHAFPPEFYFHRRERDVPLAQPDALPPRIEDYLLLMDGDRLAGVTSGFAGREPRSVYWTNHTTLDTAYQGRGVYRALQERVIAYTRELGFRAIQSNHAPSNNGALIPKLRAGFKIVSLELDGLEGPILRLRYFHDPEEEAAYLFRNGNATLSPELIGRGHGGIALLRAQFREADEAERGRAGDP